MVNAYSLKYTSPEKRNFIRRSLKQFCPGQRGIQYPVQVFLYCDYRTQNSNCDHLSKESSFLQSQLAGVKLKPLTSLRKEKGVSLGGSKRNALLSNS